MKRKVLCPLLTAAVIGTSMTANAFGGGYPKHPETNPLSKETENSTMNCWTPSDERYVFTVDEKRFVLLDTDEEGNYFVLAEDEYGKYPFTTAYANNPTIETRVVNGGDESFVPGAAHDMDDEAWFFDTENQTSIGYWLNHEFYEEGNGSSYILPDEIKSGIIEKEWQVEGYKPVAGWQSASYGGGAGRVNDFIDSRYHEGYTVTGRIALLSYTEYKAYEGIIGWTYCALGWDGFMLRTPYALINGDATTLKYTFGSMQIKNRTAAVDTSGKMIIAVNDVPNSSNFYVRPVMWLDKDFFTTTAIDLSTAGEIVKDEISKNGMASLSAIYTDEELELLGFDVANAPKADGCYVAGTPAEGALLYSGYDYSSPVGSAEGESETEWFISDEADGEYIPLGISGKTIKTDSSMSGKYLKCRVTPKDSEGRSGRYYWSEPTSAVTAMDIPIVTGVRLGSSNTEVTIANNSQNTESVKLIKVVYDEDNTLVSVAGQEPIEIASGKKAIRNMDISEKNSGKKVAFMVWIGNSEPVFYMSFGK